MNNQAKGVAFSVLSGLALGGASYFAILLLNEDFSIPHMLFWRFMMAALFALPFIILNKTLSLKNLKKNSKNILGFLFLSSTFCAMSYLCDFIAAVKIGTGLAMVIFFSFPIFVALLRWVLDGIKPGIYTIISLISVIVGCSFIALGEGIIFNLNGIMWGLISSITFAIYTYYNKSYVEKLAPSLLTFLNCISTASVFFIFTSFSGDFFIPKNMFNWNYILILSIVCTLVPILLFNEGMKYLSSTKASILAVLEPAVTLLIGVLFLDENLTKVQTIGILIIIASTFIVQFEKEN